MNFSQNTSSSSLDLRSLAPGQILRVPAGEEKALRSLLRGDFSKNLIARTVPQMKIEVGARQSYVFEIVEAPSSSGLQRFVTGLRLLKRQDLILIFFPFLLVLLTNLRMGLVPPTSALLLCFSGLLSMTLSLRFRNEYVDHLRGTDRWNPEFSRSPLVRGDLRALEMNHWALAFLGMALLSLLGLLFLNPMLALVAAPAAILALYSQYFHLSAFKEKPYGEVLIFVLFGPLFLSGIELALFQRVQAWTLAYGFLVGLSSMFLLNLKVFANFLFLSQMESQNTLIRYGFDRSKNYLLFLEVLIFVTFFAYQSWLLKSTSLSWLGLIVLGLLLSGVFLRSLLAHRKCQSSAGSTSGLLRDRGTESIYVIYLLWLGIQLWLAFVPGA